MLVFGGQVVVPGKPPVNITPEALFLLDLVQQTWYEVKTSKKSRPPQRYAHSAVVADDQMLIFGGMGKGDFPLNDLWSFSFTALAWTNISTPFDCPSPRCGHVAALFRGSMYVCGGAPLRTCDLNSFNVASQVWRPHSNLPLETPRCGHYSCVTGGFFIVFGGNAEAGVWVRGTRSRNWSSFAVVESASRKPLTAWGRGSAAAVVNRSIIVTGGRDSGGYCVDATRVLRLPSEVSRYPPQENIDCTTANPLLSIGQDILLQIFASLPATQVARMRRVDKALCQIASNNDLWHKFFHQDFPESDNSSFCSNWSHLYSEKARLCALFRHSCWTPLRSGAIQQYTGTCKYTVAVVGFTTTGKSCMILRFLWDSFFNDYEPTFEEQYSKTIYSAGNCCNLRIKDTSGLKEYEYLLGATIQQADCLIFVYSVSMRASFEHVQGLIDDVARQREFGSWAYPSKKSTKSRGRPGAVLVGNMVDQPEAREVAIEEGMHLAMQHSMPFYETSAKTGMQVANVFHEVVYEIERARNKLVVLLQ
eukprot:TRINITY_DN298_c0_g1_i4.p1 TRINITY_DN298_c0_g1~~TRINITY_DN298_c0_g1_i4.p1  ORF type:complete len:533 (-),score=75.78 TRINITY_DN298_c0_g1_i4:44-1642(-)